MWLEWTTKKSMTEYTYTVNGAESTICLNGRSEVSASTLLFQAGFLRHNSFNLYRGGEDESLDTADLEECSDYVAVPSNFSPSNFQTRK